MSDRKPLTAEQAEKQSRRFLEHTNELSASLRDGLELVESAFAHVSHGGPTRSDAEKWIEQARKTLAAKEAPRALAAEVPQTAPIIAWADIGSHGHIFEFAAGPVAERYPHLLHIFSEQVTSDLVRVEIRIAPQTEGKP